MPSVRGPELTSLAMNAYLLTGVGERFANSDGSRRQDELGRYRPGERIRLQREAENSRDRLAVALCSYRAVQAGYIGREHAR